MVQYVRSIDRMASVDDKICVDDKIYKKSWLSF